MIFEFPYLRGTWKIYNDDLDNFSHLILRYHVKQRNRGFRGVTSVRKIQGSQVQGELGNRVGKKCLFLVVGETECICYEVVQKN